MYLENQDPDVFAAIKHEDKRQEESLEMIASENFVSQAVLEAYHSTLTNKYAEGYPGKRTTSLRRTSEHGSISCGSQCW